MEPQPQHTHPTGDEVNSTESGFGITAGRVDDTTQETETEWSPEKKKTAFTCCGIVIALIIIAALLGAGGLMIQKGQEYQDATKEQCELTNYDSKICTYDCSCSGTGSKKRCSTCYGTKYRYYAIAEAKCGTETELQADSYDGSCEYSWLKSMGSSHTCYVPDCDKGEFSWSSGSTNTGVGIALVVVGCLVCICGCCYVLYILAQEQIKECLGGDDETNDEIKAEEDGDNGL